MILKNKSVYQSLVKPEGVIISMILYKWDDSISIYVPYNHTSIPALVAIKRRCYDNTKKGNFISFHAVDFNRVY